MTHDTSKVLEIVLSEIRRSQSPWADRKEAADYCHCSVSEIDKAANAGVIRRFFRNGTPMFRKSGHPKSLDAWIENGGLPAWRKKLKEEK